MEVIVTPLPLLKKGAEGFLQCIELLITPGEKLQNKNSSLKVLRGKCVWEFNTGVVNSVQIKKEIFLPEVKAEESAEFIFSCNGEKETTKVLFKPVRKWTVHLVLHSHTDLGFTGAVSDVAKIHNDNTDAAIRYCKETEHWPEGSRFKWTCEISWQVQNYIRDRKPEKVEELMKLVRNKNIEIAAMYAGELTELLGHEQAIRSFYYAAKLRREYNISIDTAMLCDVPGCTKGFVQLMSKAGINNFIIADNNFIAPFLKRTDLPRPFYWKGYDNTKVLSWYTDHPFYAYIEGRNYGLSESYSNTREKLPQKLISLEDSGYAFDDFQLQYAFDNFELEFKPAEVVKEWNEKWEYPKIKLATAGEFLNEVRNKHEDVIPVREGDWTNWWDGIVTGFPYETSQSRTVHSKVPALEILASTVKLVNKKYEYPAEKFTTIYDNSLAFDEHSGTGMVWEPKSDEEQEKALKEGYGFINDAFNESFLLEEEIKNNFTKLIKTDSDSIVVFNTLSWQRNGKVEVSVNRQDEDVTLQDNLTKKKHKAIIKDYKLSFYAEGIPAMGYKTYEILPRTKNDSLEEKLFPVENDQKITFENSYWKISIDKLSGKIKSVFNKKLNTEIASGNINSPMVYEPKPVVQVEMGKFIPEIYNGDEVPGEIKSIDENYHAEVRTYTNETGFLTCNIDVYLGNNRWLVQKVILENDIIKFENVIDGKLIHDKNFIKEYLSEQRMLYYRFSFRTPNCELRYEAPCSIIEPAKEQFAGSCKDYSAVQSWFQLYNNDVVINFSSLDAPLIDFGGIALMKYRKKFPANPEDFYVRAITLSELTGRSQSPYTIHPSLTFRFALSANDPNEKYAGETVLPSMVPAYRLGHEFHNGLIAASLNKNVRGILPGNGFSILSISEPYIQIMTIKKAEDNEDIIIRLRELLGMDRTTTITLNMPGLISAYKTAITEEVIEEISLSGNGVEITFTPFSIQTLRFIYSK